MDLVNKKVSHLRKEIVTVTYRPRVTYVDLIILFSERAIERTGPVHYRVRKPSLVVICQSQKIAVKIFLPKPMKEK